MGLIPCNCPAPGSSIRGHRQQSFRAFAAFALKQRGCKCAFVPRFTATPAGYDGPNGVTNGCALWFCCFAFDLSFVCCVVMLVVFVVFVDVIMQRHVIIAIIFCVSDSGAGCWLGLGFSLSLVLVPHGCSAVPKAYARAPVGWACRGDGQCPVIFILLFSNTHSARLFKAVPTAYAQRPVG